MIHLCYWNKVGDKFHLFSNFYNKFSKTLVKIILF